MSKGPPAVLAVVVPAQNEERRLPRCLAALDRSRAALDAATRRQTRVEVIVVADQCHDLTERIAGRWPAVTVLTCDLGRVGAVRAMGVAHALRSASPPEQIWIACTDADSEVPVDWLSTQLDFASRGVDLLLGTVRPDSAEISAQAHRSWLDAHELGDGHRHIHGANLGVAGDIYLTVGGFPNVAAHEDVALADRIEAAGGIIVRTGASPVLTSARTRGRTPIGLATYLKTMLRQP